MYYAPMVVSKWSHIAINILYKKHAKAGPISATTPTILTIFRSNWIHLGKKDRFEI